MKNKKKIRFILKLLEQAFKNVIPKMKVLLEVLKMLKEYI